MQKFKTIDEAVDYAIREETKAFEFYQALAAQTQRPEFRQALEGLAAEELQHRMRMEDVKRNQPPMQHDKQMIELSIAESVPDVTPSPNMTYTELLQVAMKKELNAYRTYTHLAQHAHGPELKELFKQLAREEAEHKVRLEVEYGLLTF